MVATILASLACVAGSQDTYTIFFGRNRNSWARKSSSQPTHTYINNGSIKPRYIRLPFRGGSRMTAVRSLSNSCTRRNICSDGPLETMRWDR